MLVKNMSVSVLLMLFLAYRDLVYLSLDISKLVPIFWRDIDFVEMT